MTTRLRFTVTLVVAVFLHSAIGLATAKPAEKGTENSITPQQAKWTDAKKTAVAWVDANRARLTEVSRILWKYAEPGMLEYRSATLLGDALEKEGFTLERGVAGMPTAFVARYGSGKPVIGILAEYDALGGLSQNAAPDRSPRIKGAAGHGCGHSLFGAGSVGAAMAVAKAIKDGKASGTVVLFGTPNEEGVVGKAYMARAGLFDDLDACLHWHPNDKNEIETGESGNDLTSFMVAFYGQTAHSAGAPWKGRSALDAIELMGVMSNYYREHLHPSARIHYVIMEGGKAPNVVPDFAKAWFYLRGGTREMVDEMYDRMQKIARAAALATDTREELRLFTSINHLRNNTEGAKVVHANLQLIGSPEFTEQEQAFARAIQKTLEIEEKGLATSIEPLKPFEERDLDHYIGSGSTDVAEVSLITPTVGLNVASWVLGSPGHHWSVVACAGHSTGEKGMLVAAKVLAATALDIMQEPGTLAAMRDEFEKTMNGKKYLSSIPADVEPPTLPDPYENPGWEPGDLDYPTWSSFVWSDEARRPEKSISSGRP
ncbi:MAG: amidohydrolase [Acidobacteriota bacterium]